MLKVEEQPTTTKNGPTSAPPVIDEDYIKQFAAKTLDQASVITNNFPSGKGKGNKGEVRGFFNCYHWFDQTTGRFKNSFLPQVSAQGPTKTGGRYFRLSPQIMITRVTPGPNFRVNENGTTEARCPDIYYNGNEVKEYILEHQLEPFYNPETGELNTSAWFPISESFLIDSSLMMFSQNDVNVLSEQDDRRLYKIRKGQVVDLSNAALRVTVKLKTREYEKDGKKNVQQSFEPNFSLEAGSMTLEPHSELDGLSVAEKYKTVVNRDAKICQNLTKVDLKTVPLVPKATFYLSAQGLYVADDRSVIRQTIPLTHPSQVFAKADDPDSAIMINLSFREQYTQDQLDFVHYIKVWQNQANGMGLDTENKKLLSGILLNHPLSMFVFASLREEETRDLPMNDPQRLPAQQVHGNYVWTADDIEVDWIDTLINHGEGIEIKKETFIRALKEPNANKDSADKLVKEVIEDGKPMLQVRSILPQTSPLAADGKYSRVLNFGCGDRPLFTCGDTLSILDREGVRFFALTTTPKADTVAAAGGDLSTLEASDKAFLTQYASGVLHQLFVIQYGPNSGQTEKKVVQ